MSNFRVGMRVVCVIGGKIPSTSGHVPVFGYPQKGEIYTIRELKCSPFYNTNNAVLSELANPWINDPSYDAGWVLSRFRPLVSEQDDIALFHALCPGLPVVPPAVVPKRQSVTSHSD